MFGPVRKGGRGRRKKLQRRFAGWWPAANKAERRRKAGGEFPAASHETALRSPIDRWCYAVVQARYTHTRPRGYSLFHPLQPFKMEHDRNSSSSRHPRLPTVRIKMGNEKMVSNERGERKREICQRKELSVKREGRAYSRETRKTPSLANYSRSLARIAWPFPSARKPS